MISTSTATTLEEKFIQDIDTRSDELRAEIERLSEVLREPQAELDRLQELKRRMTGGKATRTRSPSSSNGRADRGSRQEQFVKLVREKPGITIREAAGAMGAQPNYLYRLRNQAEEAGQIRKEDGKLYPLESAETASAPAPASA